MARMFEHATLYIFSNGAQLAKRAVPSTERATKRQDGHPKFRVCVRRVPFHVLTKRPVVGEAPSQCPADGFARTSACAAPCRLAAWTYVASTASWNTKAATTIERAELASAVRRSIRLSTG